MVLKSKFFGRVLCAGIVALVVAIFISETRAAVPDVENRIVGRAVSGTGLTCPADLRMEISSFGGYNPRWGGFLQGVFRFGKIPAGRYLGQVFFTSPEVGTEFTPSSVLRLSVDMDDLALRTTGGVMETPAVWFPGVATARAMGVLVSGNGTACTFLVRVRPRPPTLEPVVFDDGGKG